MHLFIIMFISRINLMINKYTSYIIVLECLNTAARKRRTERENYPHCNLTAVLDSWILGSEALMSEVLVASCNRADTGCDSMWHWRRPYPVHHS